MVYNIGDAIMYTPNGKLCHYPGTVNGLDGNYVIMRFESSDEEFRILPVALSFAPAYFRQRILSQMLLHQQVKMARLVWKTKTNLIFEYGPFCLITGFLGTHVHG